jgi:hypothetical protein
VLAPIGTDTEWFFGKPDPDWEWVGEGPRCDASWPPTGRNTGTQCELRSSHPAPHSALLSSL